MFQVPCNDLIILEQQSARQFEQTHPVWKRDVAIIFYSRGPDLSVQCLITPAVFGKSIEGDKLLCSF